MPFVTFDRYAAALTRCLHSLRESDETAARRWATEAAESGSVLGRALALFLDSSRQMAVYESPAAFKAFARGGGNVTLYRESSAALQNRYDARPVQTLLDIGPGDGLALCVALAAAGSRPIRLDLVEPSEALLTACEVWLTELDLGIEVRGHRDLIQHYLADLERDQRWDLVQATFSFQSVAPMARLGALRELRKRTAELIILEFDVPEWPGNVEAHLRWLAERYDRGIAEYEEPELVSQGFLIPMLVGQIQSEAPRNNWEQPAQSWVNNLMEAGFTDVTIEPICDYWWSPVVQITGR